MALFKVSLTGHFSNEIDVEFEPDEYGMIDEAEVEALAVRLFEEAYYPCGQWAESWDYVQADGVEEVE
jgi:hypothetical protein